MSNLANHALETDMGRQIASARHYVHERMFRRYQMLTKEKSEK